jgi:hypothetical protein
MVFGASMPKLEDRRENAAPAPGGVPRAANVRRPGRLAFGSTSTRIRPAARICVAAVSACEAGAGHTRTWLETIRKHLIRDRTRSIRCQVPEPFIGTAACAGLPVPDGGLYVFTHPSLWLFPRAWLALLVPLRGSCLAGLVAPLNSPAAVNTDRHLAHQGFGT